MVDGTEIMLALDGRCVSENLRWSVTDIAASNAQLAGVLAGFMILAITVILGSRQTEYALAPLRQHASSSATGEVKRVPTTHTLALSATGLLVLGLDAYLFGSIAATKPPDPSVTADDIVRQVCKSAWIQLMPAAGMLAVGATLLVAGISWMLTQHAGAYDAAGKKDNAFAALGNVLALAVLIGTSVLLIFTCLMFIDAMKNEFQAEIRGDETHSVAIVSSIILLITISIGLNRVLRCLRLKGDAPWSEILRPKYGSIRTVAVFTAFFAAAGPIFAHILSRWQNHPFFETHPITDLQRLWESVALCVWVPGALYLVVAYSLPGPRSWFDRRLVRLWSSVRKGWKHVKERGSEANSVAQLSPEEKEAGAAAIRLLRATPGDDTADTTQTADNQANVIKGMLIVGSDLLDQINNYVGVTPESSLNRVARNLGIDEQQPGANVPDSGEPAS